MKVFYLVSLLFFSFFIFGCKDETTNPNFSMEEKINNARSFQFVDIYLSDSQSEHYHTIFHHFPYIKLIDAWAENGFLIITKEQDGIRLNVYYNLSLVKSYRIYAQSSLYIYY